MKLHQTLMGLAMALAVTTAAQAEVPAKDAAVNSVVIHTIDGKTSIERINAAQQAELIASQHARQLEVGIVVLVANGKTYVIDDHKMPNGKPMVQSLIDWSNESNGGN